jgi:hypothetical protein
MFNPFKIDIEDKDEYTNEDYIKIQKLLDEKNIDETLNKFYPPKDIFYEYNDFKKRCSRGINQKLIDVSNNIFPTKTLYKIGAGGNNKNCIVCCTPINHKSHDLSNDSYQKNSRYNASQTIKESLEKSGYNGYFYLFNGGFPNPTGKEMKYVAVPYCFKIFMMLEAKKKGFENVLWVDAGCIAIRNPDKLFETIETGNVLAHFIYKDNRYNMMAFERTLNLLNCLTDTVINSDTNYIVTVVFGLNLNNKTVNDFIKDYYLMVELGVPFLSIFPEEIVISALFNKPEYKSMLYEKYDHEISDVLIADENAKTLETAKEEGYWFFQRNYKNFM